MLKVGDYIATTFGNPRRIAVILRLCRAPGNRVMSICESDGELWGQPGSIVDVLENMLSYPLSLCHAMIVFPNDAMKYLPLNPEDGQIVRKGCGEYVYCNWRWFKLGDNISLHLSAESVTWCMQG